MYDQGTQCWYKRSLGSGDSTLDIVLEYHDPSGSYHTLYQFVKSEHLKPKGTRNMVVLLNLSLHSYTQLLLLDYIISYI